MIQLPAANGMRRGLGGVGIRRLCAAIEELVSNGCICRKLVQNTLMDILFSTSDTPKAFLWSNGFQIVTQYSHLSRNDTWKSISPIEWSRKSIAGFLPTTNFSALPYEEFYAELNGDLLNNRLQFKAAIGTNEEVTKVNRFFKGLSRSISENWTYTELNETKKIADQMEPPIESARVVVTILQTIPIPTTIGGPGPIGVIFSIPIGVQNRYADLLRISCMIVENLSSDVEAIRSLANLTFSKIDPLLAKLQSIDIKLASCVEQMNEEDRNRILSSIDNLPSNLALAKGGDSKDNVFSYKNYTITIVEDPNSPTFAKRRFAQVENESGVVLMKGPSSFSSSTRILIDEIKFRINNQLP